MPYLSEYFYAASPTYWTYKGYSDDGNDYSHARGSNWMFTDDYFWTISRVSDRSDKAFDVGYRGSVYGNRVYYDASGVDLTFNLLSSVKTSGGSGSASDPYRIEL